MTTLPNFPRRASVSLKETDKKSKEQKKCFSEDVCLEFLEKLAEQMCYYKYEENCILRKDCEDALESVAILVENNRPRCCDYWGRMCKYSGILRKIKRHRQY